MVLPMFIFFSFFFFFFFSATFFRAISLEPLLAETPNGVFGKLPSHQMAVAIMCLIGKEIREIHFGHRALPYILCAYKYIQCLNEPFQSFPYIW